MSAPVYKRARILFPPVRQPPGTGHKRSPFERLFHLDFGTLYNDLSSFLPRKDVGTLSCVCKDVHRRLQQYGFCYKPSSNLVFYKVQETCHAVFDSPVDGRLSLILSKPGKANSEKVACVDVEKYSGEPAVESISSPPGDVWAPKIMTFPCGKIGYFRRLNQLGDNGLRHYVTFLMTSTNGGSTWVEQEVPILSDINGFASVVLRDGSILVTGGTHISVFHHNLILRVVQPNHSSHVFRGQDGGATWEQLPAMEESLTTSRPYDPMKWHSMVVVDARPEDGALAQKYGVVILVGGVHMCSINHLLYSYDGGTSWKRGPSLPRLMRSFYQNSDNIFSDRTYDYAFPILVGVGSTFFMFGGTREDVYPRSTGPVKAQEVWMTRDRGLTWELVCPLSHLNDDGRDSDFDRVSLMTPVCNGVYKVVHGRPKLFLTFTLNSLGEYKTDTFELTL